MEYIENKNLRPLKITGKKLKIAFDTNVLVFILEEPLCKSYFDEKIEKIKNGSYLFIYEYCKKEAINVLVRDYKYDRKDAEEKVNSLIKEYGFNIIKVEDSHINNAEAILYLCKDMGLHEPDNLIISGYKENGIDIVYSNDNAFLNCCRYFGIDARKFPNVDRLIADNLRKLFKR